jgi:hypothetical protein
MLRHILFIYLRMIHITIVGWKGRSRFDAAIKHGVLTLMCGLNPAKSGFSLFVFILEMKYISIKLGAKIISESKIYVLFLPFANKFNDAKSTTAFPLRDLLSVCTCECAFLLVCVYVYVNNSAYYELSFFSGSN